MAWISRLLPSRDPTPADATLLREALVQALSTIAAQQDSHTQGQIKQLIERLDRFPTPTGLSTRLGQILKPIERELPTPKTSRTIGRPTRPTRPPQSAPSAKQPLSSLSRALARSALEDEEIAKHIRAIRRAIATGPDAQGADDIVEHSARIEDLAGPVRRKQHAVQQELVNILEEITRQLESADGSSNRMGGHLSNLATAVAEAQDPQGLRRLRGRVTRLLSQMQEESQLLRAALEASVERAARLERKVRRRSEQLEMARNASLLDGLTGVYNRTWFDQELPRLIAEQQHDSTELSLLLLDLDHFKVINDTHGHPMGDQVLVSVVKSMGSTLRDRDSVARVGGEEFVVLLPSATLEQALGIAERIRRGIARLSFASAKGPFTITISVGAAALQADDDEETLYKRADTALYAAKKGGRDRVMAA